MKYYITYLIIIICPNLVFGQITRQDTIDVLSKAIELPVLIKHLVKNDSILGKNFVGIKQNDVLSDQTLMIYVDNSIHKSKQIPIWGREGCFNHGCTHEFIYLSVGQSISRVIYKFLPTLKNSYNIIYSDNPSFRFEPHLNIFVELEKVGDVWQITHYEIRDLIVTCEKETYPVYYQWLQNHYTPMSSEEARK